jgi:hypothetical protein
MAPLARIFSKGTCVGVFALIAAASTLVAIRVNRQMHTDSPDPTVSSPGFFANVTPDSGVDFSYRNGEEADQFAILEQLGGGVALLDYDGDGLLDIFVTGGGYFDGTNKEEIKGHPCKLYKNLGNFKFKDVTAEVGLDKIDFYTHGAAVGDYNNDGWPDLLVTGWGRVQLFRNEDNGHGGRKFVDVTQEAGLNDKLWSSSACFMDLDGKGYPDLYVAHYVDWNPKTKHPTSCHGDNLIGKRDICPPGEFLPLPHTLYRNNGDGTFTDISDSCGLRRDGICDKDGKALPVNSDGQPDPNGSIPVHGKALAVIAVDTANRGRPDIMVANDQTYNFFYHNQSTLGTITLREMAMKLGVGTDGVGRATGNMGIAEADLDRTGYSSLLISTFQNQSPCLYHNRGVTTLGEPMFEYGSEQAGLYSLDTSNVSWGIAFLDIENCGWQDVVIMNGHINRFPRRGPIPQYPTLLRSSRKKPIRFAGSSGEGGPYFHEQHRARGLAYGDLDNDGRIDLVISNVNEPVTILRNVCPPKNHWIGIDLKGAGHPDIIGSRIILHSAQGTQTRYVHSGGSYASSSDPRIVFGIGQDNDVSFTVIWSHNGLEQTFEHVAVDHYWRITEENDKPQRTD